MNRIWILGAADPEMAAIEGLLRGAGETVVYATVRGERARPANAYASSLPEAAAQVALAGGTVYLVECCALPMWADHTEQVRARCVCIDHHHPGDPGYGRPPSEFMAASSLGQVISELARLGRLPASRQIGASWESWFSGEMHRHGSDGIIRYAAGPQMWLMNTRRENSAEFTAPFTATETLIPHELVLTSAADHCLGAAYRGECPGVDPDELMRWRVESRARFQGRDPAEVLADIERARAELSLAERIGLHPIDRYGYCQGCGVKCRKDESWDYCECTRIADMRRDMPVPELVEAATRDGVSYVSGPLICPDGRRKYTVSGTPDVVRAWLMVWAPAHGIVDTYGDPARGFAGGYERDA